MIILDCRHIIVLRIICENGGGLRFLMLGQCKFTYGLFLIQIALPIINTVLMQLTICELTQRGLVAVVGHCWHLSIL